MIVRRRMLLSFMGLWLLAAAAVFAIALAGARMDPPGRPVAIGSSGA